MTDPLRLGPWIRRFLLEHLVQERNLSRGTQRSYRDTLTLLLPFVARQTRKGVEELNVVHVSADSVRKFLLYLEESRKCAISTRNQRLAAIHSLARFVALHSPEHLAWCGEICALPFKPKFHENSGQILSQAIDYTRIRNADGKHNVPM
jgi:integrase/recombinase XerD